jgi:ABC-2 type transport system ATP-binding protein
VVLAGEGGAFREAWERRGLSCRTETGQLVLQVKGDVAVAEVLKDALARGLDVVEVAPRYQTLEELFVSKARGGDADPSP